MASPPSSSPIAVHHGQGKLDLLILIAEMGHAL
jgi:hypothetical protein